MDNQGCAAVSEERTVIRSHVDVLIGHRRIRGSVFLHHEIIHVAGVRALRILQAVFFRVRIKMFSGSFKRWTFTLTKLVEVDGVGTRRKVFQIQLNSYAFARRRQSGSTDRLTLSVL